MDKRKAKESDLSKGSLGKSVIIRDRGLAPVSQRSSSELPDLSGIASANMKTGRNCPEPDRSKQIPDILVHSSKLARKALF